MNSMQALVGLPAGFAGVLLFSAGVCLLWALGETVQPGRRDFVFIGVLLALGLIQWHSGLVLSRAILDYSFLFQIHTPAIFAIGPLLHRFLRARIEPEGRNRLWPHLIPALVVLGLMSPYYFSGADDRLGRIQGFYQGETPHPTTLLFLAGIAHALFYIAWSALPVFRILTWRRIQREPVLRVVCFLIASFIFIGCGMVFSLMGGTHGRLNIFAALAAAMVPILYLIQRRYPEFFEQLENVVQTEKYRRSQLPGMDLDAIQSRLDRLMESEQCFKEEGLTLSDLAGRLDLSTHQLSEYLNRHLGINFARYINRQRVLLARELLGSEPDRTVLSIAYETGFNSKAAFNNAFTRETGMTPTRYRASLKGRV